MNIIKHITKRQAAPTYEVFAIYKDGQPLHVVHKIGSGGAYIAASQEHDKARGYCDARNLLEYRLSVEASFPYPINRILLHFIPKPK